MRRCYSHFAEGNTEAQIVIKKLGDIAGKWFDLRLAWCKALDQKSANYDPRVKCSPLAALAWAVSSECFLYFKNIEGGNIKNGIL